MTLKSLAIFSIASSNSAKPSPLPREDGSETARRPVPESTLEERQGLLVELGEDLKLDKVHPPFARLDLRNEARLLPHLSGDLSLCKPSIGAGFLELARKSPVRRAVEATLCFGHRLSLSDKQAYYAGLIAPKIGASHSVVHPVGEP